VGSSEYSIFIKYLNIEVKLQKDRNQSKIKERKDKRLEVDWLRFTINCFELWKWSEGFIDHTNNKIDYEDEYHIQDCEQLKLIEIDKPFPAVFNLVSRWNVWKVVQ